MTQQKQPNRHLAAVIAEAGCTYEALAKEVRTVAAESGDTLRTSKAAVHQWVAAGALPVGRTPAYIAEALSRKLNRTVTVAEIALGRDPVEGTPPRGPMAVDPLATAADLGRLIMLRRRDLLALTFSTAAVDLPLAYDHHSASALLRSLAAGRRIGAHEIATVRQFTEMFRATDERLGGGHGLIAVTSYLTDVVTPMLKGTFTTAGARAAAFGAASELANLIGWKLHDAGREGAAQRVYLLAHQFACESDPAGHAAWAMRALAHQALDLGHTRGCVDLAEAALARARGKTDRRTEALLLVTAARAHGATGNGPRAAELILAAEDALLATDDSIPTYAAAAGPPAATIASHTGRTLTAMNDHTAAERHYRAALRNRTPGTYHRMRATTLANIAKSVAAQHRAEEAVSLWSKSLDLMDGLDSKRNRNDMHTMRSTLTAYARRGIPGAADLARRAARIVPT
ncbi:tetratricopeptide repeat protein [Kitasatospora sp. NPDC056327]|uniref:tetratricopeptide repeat protein n=1 Tax=Kitasatospora sp. NPDC056327 TaxID=3345785 RepID=UPI0035E2C8E9